MSSLAPPTRGRQPAVADLAALLEAMREAGWVATAPNPAEGAMPTEATSLLIDVPGGRS
ncbi:hypothetical protein [Nocardia ignorata]|uniref:Uncharacterized protein n=1 Tax=Nocardia ignorata TaxID=145285 RepID=A0A4R6P5F1_NOCIG|nr:hypothetical protein [Nocardia ignorata]TDP33074.1 hypothetical protein DFR75_105312 [Nocardia ignorata]